jgi:hypothetical protein
MDGRAFLSVADRLARAATEGDWRTAAGRTYYGLLHEGRSMLERWGFPMGPGDSIHRFVRLRFAFPADLELKYLGNVLESLGKLRNQADYRLRAPGSFANANAVQTAVQDARKAVALLDAIEADPARRAAAVAAVRAAFP